MLSLKTVCSTSDRSDTIAQCECSISLKHRLELEDTETVRNDGLILVASADDDKANIFGDYFAGV